MRIYEERNNKRDFQCGYCFTDGHNKRHCPHMKQHWDANADLKGLSRYEVASATIKGVDKNMFPTQWHSYYTDADAVRQFRAHWQYMSDRFSTKPKAKPKKRKKAKCGFCGSTAHNRRNCNKLKNFIYVLNQTNKAYRSAFYDKFIEGMGLGAGALVSMRNPYGYNDQLNGVAIVTALPTEQIMFTNLKRSWSDYSTRAETKVLINGETAKFDLVHDCFYTESESNDHDEGVWSPMFSRWGRILDVVSPAPNRPTKDWFLGQSPCFDWIVKKRNQQTLMYEFASVIKHFYPHNNLRAKLGAKVYDQYYTR